MTGSPVTPARSPWSPAPERREEEKEEQQWEDPEEGEEPEAPISEGTASVAPSPIDHYGRCSVLDTGRGGAESTAFETVLVGGIDSHSDEHHCECYRQDSCCPVHKVSFQSRANDQDVRRL